MTDFLKRLFYKSSAVSTEESIEYSESVSEIVSEVPGWLVRWGVSVFSVIFVGFILIASWIKMPDLVKGVAIIESQVPPEHVICKVDGRLIRLFVKENALVDSGAILGYMQSTAHHDDVLELSTLIDKIHGIASKGSYDNILHYQMKSERHLGELQVDFNDFSENYTSFRAFLANGLYEKKKKSLRGDINYINSMSAQLEKQLKLQKKDYGLSQTEFEAFKKLYDKKVISPQEYRIEESKMINKQIPIENTLSSILNNRSLANQKEADLMQLENEITERKANFLASVDRFKSKIDEWKSLYVLQANRSGKVVFSNRIFEDKWINNKEYIMTIEPEISYDYIARMSVNQFSYGKIMEGQRVILKLNAYPYQEFGQLNGKIEYLGGVSYTDSLYTARINLINGNVSTYGKRIKLKNGLVAQAEIVTRERNLLSKLFDNIYSVLKNR